MGNIDHKFSSVEVQFRASSRRSTIWIVPSQYIFGKYNAKYQLIILDNEGADLHWI